MPDPIFWASSDFRYSTGWQMINEIAFTGCVFIVLAFPRAAIGQDSPATSTNPAATAQPRDTTGKDRWVANHYGRMMKLAEHSPEKFKVVFVGDSITKKWLDLSGGLWTEHFGDVDSPFYALNLGVPGDRSDHLLHRLKAKSDGGLGNLDNPQINPKVFVLMIGTNNLFPPHTAEQISGGVEAVATRLRKLRPDANIVICSIIPSHKPAIDNQQVIPANEALPGLADRMGKKVRYLDLYPEFLNDEGEKKHDYYVDGLHLNENGYKVWYHKLKPALVELLR